jgi:hypothetical protein
MVFQCRLVTSQEQHVSVNEHDDKAHVGAGEPLAGTCGREQHGGEVPVWGACVGVG